MQKKITLALTACFAASTIWAGSTFAYDNGYQGQHKPSDDYGKPSVEQGKPSGNGQYDPQKGLKKQLMSVDKQLNKIDQNITKYESKFNKWTKDDDDDNDQDKDKDKDNDKNKDQDKQKDQEQDKQQDQDSDKTNDDKKAEELPQTYSVDEQDEDQDQEQDESEDNEKDEEQADDEEDELAEEIDEAVEEYNEYTGKFTALSKRLDGISKQLDSLSARGLEEALISERRVRIEELRTKLTGSVEKMTAVQDQVIEKIKNDHTAEEKAPKEEKLTTKAWNIYFNKKLDEASLSELTVVVYNESNELVETTISYDAVKKAVIVQPTQPYKVGSRYTLYVGKELSSQGGQQLKNSVKMQFTIR